MGEDEAPKVEGEEGAAQVVSPPKAKKESTTRPKSPTRTSAPAVRQKSLERRLHEFFGAIEQTEAGMPYLTGISGIVAIIDPRDGQAIALNSANMAKAWANLADQNERVKRYLEWMLSGGAWGEVFVATSPVIFAIMVNHGLTPKLFGPVEVTDDGGVSEGGEGHGSGGSGDSVGRVPPGI